MPNTYTQLYCQIIFAVQGRQNAVRPQNREELHKYMTGIVQNKGAKMLAVFAMPDHVHVFVGFSPIMAIADLVRDVKAGSSAFTKQKRWFRKFAWQEGYGAFTYGQSQVKDVVRYVLNQEAHHHRRTFREEYLAFLVKFEVPYEPTYLFDFYDEAGDSDGVD